ncbi:membrane protein [Klebsiella pneumoniae]|uniref:Membrane protein n=1 Tax=Klebsiella pneumoniae TaxID=573 RepID=A0A2X3EQF6_KLEPN|nr:membrane protein [Klebsiella pneumoniae]
MANGAYDACNGRGGKEGSAFYFDGLRLCLINVGLSNPYTGPTARGIGWRAAFINRRGVMRKFAPLPKSILLVEILGMELLTLAWLSLNQYVQLPAPIASPTAALVMLFAGSC